MQTGQIHHDDVLQGAGRDTGVHQRAMARTGASQSSAWADVLLVHADPAQVEALLTQLVNDGLRPRVAHSVEQALAALDAALPDALVVAHTLPDGLGYRIVAELRSRPHGDKPPALVLGRGDDVLDQSEAIHAGADATFEVPVDWNAVSRRLDQLLQRSAADRPRVLVVEDEPVHAALARRTLEQAGYDVHVCADPVRFREDLIAFAPDLLVLDIMLPGGVTGYDLARAVRQEEQYATMPILFLTAETQPHARIRTMQAGGDDFLVKPVHPALLVSSVASRLERARVLTMLLSRDGLTQLLSHTYFMEQAEVVLGRRRREPELPATLVMLDIDHFKQINDRFGHQAGDRVLKALAALLRRHVRRSDPVGRYGGEEFAILLDGVHPLDAMRLVRRLLEEFATMEHRGGPGTTFTATFSAGVARLDAATMDVEAWVNAADRALYDAKRAGRRRVHLAAAS